MFHVHGPFLVRAQHTTKTPTATTARSDERTKKEERKDTNGQMSNRRTQKHCQQKSSILPQETITGASMLIKGLWTEQNLYCNILQNLSLSNNRTTPRCLTCFGCRCGFEPRTLPCYIHEAPIDQTDKSGEIDFGENRPRKSSPSVGQPQYERMLYPSCLAENHLSPPFFQIG